MKSWNGRTRLAGVRRCSPLGAAALLAIVPAAQAGSVQLGEDTSLEYLASITYSAAVRVEDPGVQIEADVNGDDATRNFDNGALINNRLALLGELDFRAGRYGLFLRGSGFYDDVYRQDNDNDSPSTVNKDGAHDEFTGEARKYLGADLRLLDAYAYGSFDLGPTSLDLRLGRQVVSWGESLFFPNTSGAQGPVDATKSNVAGTEVKDILLPEEQILLQWGLTSNWSVAGYYQTNWKSTDLVPVGGYFSQSDVTGPGARFLIVQQLPPPLDHVPRGADISPDDDGQWGVSTKFLLGEATELGLHYLNYHDRNPTGVVITSVPIEVAPGVFVPVPIEYQVFYADDVKMTSVSVGSDLFGTAVGAEVSYRQDAGMNIDVGTSPTPGRGDAVQANLNFTKIILPTRLLDTLTLLGEVSWLRVTEVTPIEVSGMAFDDVSNGREAAAYQALAQFGYKQVFPGWDMTVSAVYANEFKGKSPIGGALGSLTGQGDTRYLGGVTLKYLSNLELQLAYNGYGGTPNADHKLADRSYVSFSAKYAF